ncbi:MAG: cytochrome C [Desulfuromonas sp.]|nr:MAG: cytochrome C [Desulfuromonas sp.]
MQLKQNRRLLLLAFAGVLLLATTALASHKNRIEGPISSGPEATAQCLNCHEDAATDFMKTSHWNWTLEQEIDGKIYQRGKRNALNNYCTSVASNEDACARCHAGYGMTDFNTFDFSDKTKVDCLVCHDSTGTYAKSTKGAGVPKEKVDLLYVAQNVGMPMRENCGSCHFFGGGGDAVKHGDLDSSMFYPERSTDVHMAADGNDFVCQTCHVTEEHAIPGNSIGVSPVGMSELACTECHDEPHAESRLNTHADKVACQTCHIPTYSKERATKTWWDWSKAGDKNHEEVTDEFGKHAYVQKKGEMKYGMNLVPEYAWYLDGKNEAYIRGEKFDPSKPLLMAGPTATREDKGAKIFPFKVMRGKQIYDTENNTLIAAHLIGKDGFWKTFDWQQAATIGMKAAGLPYSGNYGFAETVMFWRLNHQVSPKEDALSCLDCHGDNGRLDWSALGYKKDPMGGGK